MKVRIPILVTGFLLVGGWGMVVSAAENAVAVPIRPGQTALSYLEDVRAAGASSRPFNPDTRIVAGGAGADDDFARAFIASGEAEEINAWIVAEPTPLRLKMLRELFDAAGGRNVGLVDEKGKCLEAPVQHAKPRIEGRLSAPVFVAGSDRLYRLNPDATLDAIRMGCGNIHRVQFIPEGRQGGWVYFSNGSLFRCRLQKGTLGAAQLVYRPQNVVGGGVLGFDVQPDGNVVMAINSSAEIVELDAATMKEIVRFEVDCRDAAGKEPGAHARLRMIRKTAAGTYLVCCAGAAAVREYSSKGDLLWEQPVPVMAFDALRRANGNTLVAHITGVGEYTPDHRVVWSFSPDEIETTKLSCLCGIEELPNGNLMIGSWANGRPDASQATACEITREKKLVWTYYPSGDANMMTLSRAE